jgi:hypothetical protein
VYRHSTAGPLTLDLYRPEQGRPHPVILVTGFSDVGARARLGCAFKDTGAFTSWAETMASRGMAAVTYENTDPVADLDAVVAHVVRDQEALGVDATRLGVWACSGHAPNAFGWLVGGEPRVACAAFCYPYTFDADGVTAVASAAAQFGFVNRTDGRSANDLPATLPLAVARAGADAMPGLNAALDRLAAAALARNLPLTLTNHASGPHAFDLFDDSVETRHTIEAVLRFLQQYLVR